jgi:asparaginyl-tRNA synthetase
MERLVKKLGKADMKHMLRIQSAALYAAHSHMWDRGISQVMPVLLSTITDPLNHSVYDASIRYGGQELALTKSMILHKQVLVSGGLPGIYIVSPNVRLEKEALKDSGRHLFEFSQVDIELADARAADFMEFTEGLYREVFGFVRKQCSAELDALGRELPGCSGRFRVYDSADLREEFGLDFERELSSESSEPFWITNLCREFYDKEDPETKKHVNYDLVYPEGFGEALSGGERETEYGVIVRKMKERGTPQTAYAPYLELARKGLLRKSAGGGFGVERLVRFLSGVRHIRDVVPFERVPGDPVIM